MNTDLPRGRSAQSPAEFPRAAWKDVALRVKEQFGEDHVTLTAGGVAFFAFSSLVPLLVAAVSIYGLVSDPSDIGALVADLRGSAPGEVVDLIEQQLQNVTSTSSSTLGLTTLVSIAVALWSASSGFGHLMEAINIAYDEDIDERPFWLRRLLALGFTLGFLAMLGIGAALLSVTSGIGELAAWAVITVVGLSGLAGLYRYGPDRDDPTWSWVSVGSVFALLGWLVVSIGFRFYVANFGSYNETYGALGSVIVLLTWLYLSSVVVIVGAELNTEIERQTMADSTVGSPEPMGARGAHAADDMGPAR